MKRLFVFVASIALIPMASAQSDGMKGMDMKDMPMKGMKSEGKAQGKVHKGTGTVAKVDAEKGRVSINHEPISSMKWPAMTMDFGVKNKALLEEVKPGDKVEFSFVQSGKDHTITQLNPSLGSAKR